MFMIINIICLCELCSINHERRGYVVGGQGDKIESDGLMGVCFLGIVSRRGVRMKRG